MASFVPDEIHKTPSCCSKTSRLGLYLIALPYEIKRITIDRLKELIPSDIYNDRGEDFITLFCRERSYS